MRFKRYWRNRAGFNPVEAEAMRRLVIFLGAIDAARGPFQSKNSLRD